MCRTLVRSVVSHFAALLLFYAAIVVPNRIATRQCKLSFLTEAGIQSDLFLSILPFHPHTLSLAVFVIAFQWHARALILARTE